MLKLLLCLLLALTSTAYAARFPTNHTVKISVPPRSSAAPTGEELMVALKHSSGQKREDAIAREILSGNMPDYMRQLVPVKTTMMIRGKKHTLVFFVTPNFISVGDNTNNYVVPVNLPTALRLSRQLNMTLPTAKMVDLISGSSNVRLRSAPLPAGSQMSGTDYYRRHGRMINQELMFSAMQTNAVNDQVLIDGQKKSIILSKRLFKQPDRIAIYGWSGLNNKNIQPVSLVHKASYVDYSHGLRLVSNKALFNGRWVNLQSILKSSYADMISYEGPLTGLSSYLSHH